jgi:hypothetical protein
MGQVAGVLVRDTLLQAGARWVEGEGCEELVDIPGQLPESLGALVIYGVTL